MLLVWTLVLAACAIQLAPAYDQTLVDGLNQRHAQALTLFASVEGGSPASEFGEHRQYYAELIGGFEALRERAAGREIPPLAQRISRLRIVRDFCNSEADPTGCVNASPAALERVLEVLRRMRDRHRTRGLATDLITLFRRDYSTAIAQALTVENALRR